MRDWAYLLVTPDGVVGGAVPAVVAALRGHGFEPGPCRVLDLSTETMAVIYQESRWELRNPGYTDVSFSWAMHAELYRVAPACLLMLPIPAGLGYPDLLAGKGHKLPELADPGTVRWYGENVIFNLVHCPDDPPSALRELEVLLGTADAAALVSLTRSARPDLDGLAGVEAMWGCLPAFSGPEAISFAAIANKVRRRVLQHLAPACRDLPRLVELLAAAQRRLEAEQACLAAAATSGDRLEAGRLASPTIHGGLGEVACSLGDGTALAALAAIAEFYLLDGVRDLPAVLALGPYGVYLSPLERVILESHSYAFRPGPDLEKLYGQHPL